MRRHLLSVTVAGLMGVLVSPAIGGTSPETGDALEPTAAQRFVVEPAVLRDEAAMVIVGTALIGLAAALRRAA
jgi:hypothetical protein